MPSLIKPCRDCEIAVDGLDASRNARMSRAVMFECRNRIERSTMP